MNDGMTHCSDGEGRQYDFDGNLVNRWDPKTEKQFMEAQ